jgi:class 3 adenylate cyclase
MAARRPADALARWSDARDRRDSIRVSATPVHRDGSIRDTRFRSDVIDVRWAKCWLLVADIINSSKLVAELPADTLPLVTGQWLAQCKEAIETHGGRINQFLGDGFFAFWHDHERMGSDIDKAHQALRRLQTEGQPAFRFVTHLGTVMLGGVSVGEEQRISGSDVHFVFRMEKLAGSLGEARLLSESVRKRLPAGVEVRDAGRHSLQGFEGQFGFYAL